MKSRGKVRLLAAILVVAMVLSACGWREKDAQEGETAKEDVVLTERQKEILRENGLPEDYAALNDLQKSAITAIERMLTHLENTYHEEFVYNGYVPSGGVDPEYLTAYRKDDPQEKIITVYRKYDGSRFIYRDDYLAVVSVNEYQTELEKFFATLIPVENFCLRSEIHQISDSDAYIVKRVGGNTVAFIKDTFSDREEVREIAAACGDWLSSLECEYPVGVMFYVQAEEDFRETNIYNYSRMIHGGRYLYLVSVSLSADGEIHMHESDA